MTRSLKLIAAAVATLGFAAATPAQEAQLYGLMDLSAGRFQSAGTSKVWRAESGSMTTSFLGFKGSDDLGGGLKARFAIEHFLRADTGTTGRFNGEAFWARNAYVGLQGAFGQTVLGRNTTPLFVSTSMFNAIGDSFSFSPSIRQLFTPSLLPFYGDRAWNNSIAYASVDHSGVTWNLIANLGEGAAGAGGKNGGFNILYANGPLGATLAWQKVKNGDGISPQPTAVPVVAGFTAQDTFQLGGAYDASVVKLYAQYTRVWTHATANTKTTLYGFGAAVPIGAGKLLAQYGNAKAQAGVDTTNTALTVGYDHNLSKSTDLYAMFMTERVSGLNRGNSLAAGMRLRF